MSTSKKALIGEWQGTKHLFMAHWDKILNPSQITRRRSLQRDKSPVTYRAIRMVKTYKSPIGLEGIFWGRGLATQALNRMLQLVVERPIFARAATNNIGSIRVLQKCGFKLIGKNKDFANGRAEDTEEFILRLDLDQANQWPNQKP